MSSPTHPRHSLDEIIHAPVRFSIMAYLNGVDRAEFSVVRDAIEISDSQLSKQASTLEKAGYVKVKKGFVGKRPRTWYSLSAAGRKAFERHMEVLHHIWSGDGSSPAS